MEELVLCGANLLLKGDFDRNHGAALEWAQRCKRDRAISKFAGQRFDPFQPMVTLISNAATVTRTVAKKVGKDPVRNISSKIDWLK